MASNTDKTIVLITGANTGIGYHTAEALATSKTPYYIIITARDPIKGEAALSKLQSEYPNTNSTFSFLELDVTKAETITAAAESVEKEFGRLDVLINNAGLVPKEETLISRLRETFEANTFGPAVVTETFTPLLRKSENARLIFVTSSLGSISEKLDPANWSSPLPVLEYRMSKTALNMLAAYHHVHFEGKVKVWTYCPGYVVTDLSRTGQQGIEERKNRGAGDPRDSAAGILALVEGKRDSEVGSFVNKDGKIECAKSSNVSGDLVLITGGTGFIGIKTIHLALKAGYSVRAAVRSQAKAVGILATPSVKAINPGSRLTFAVVPDILADNAYDDAVKGVKYILHIASPTIKGETISPEQYESHMIIPALKGTTSILESAYKTSGVKRVVITSSEVAIIPWEEFISKEVDTIFDDKYETPFPAGPYHHIFEAYSASKVRALVATKEFVVEKKPVWDVINIMPSFVIGDNELVTKPEGLLEGTNAAALAQTLGRESGWGPTPSTSVHVHDVAWVHVESLKSTIAGNQNFLLAAEGEKGTKWEEAIGIINRNFPQAVKKGVLPNNGIAVTKRTQVDASRTEKVFGFKFLSYEEQVKSVVKQYLELSGEVAA